MEVLDFVLEVNLLIRKLQESMDLFEQGLEVAATKKVVCVAESVDNLESEALLQDFEAKEKLSEVRDHLNWISQRMEES